MGTLHQDYSTAANDHHAAQVRLEACRLAYAAQYLRLQELREAGDNPVAQMEAQALLIQLNTKSALAQQVAHGHVGKMRATEKRLLEHLHAEQVAVYQRLAEGLHAQLELLVALDARAGYVVPRSAGIGGYRLPAFGAMQADDTGAFKCFIHIEPKRAEHALATLLTPTESEHTDEIEPATAAAAV